MFGEIIMIQQKKEVRPKMNEKEMWAIQMEINKQVIRTEVCMGICIIALFILTLIK
jgi:hypothetical protein